MTKSKKMFVVGGMALISTLAPAAFAEQTTMACSDVIVSNDVITIYVNQKIKGRVQSRPLHIKAASPEILATLKKAQAKGKTNPGCKLRINYENGTINGVVM